MLTRSFTFSSHLAPVYALEAFGDDAFFSGGGDRVVSLCRISNPEVATAIVQTASGIFSLLYLPEKKILLIGGSEGHFHVVDLDAKKELQQTIPHEKGIFNILFSEKYKKTITAGGDGKISVYDDKFKLTDQKKISEGKIRALAFNKDQSLFFAGSGEGTVRIFETESLNEVDSFQAHETAVNVIEFHPEEDLIITGGRDAHLRIWNAKNYQLIKSIPAHNYAVYSIAFSPDKKIFATASRDKTIKIWDSKSFEIIKRLDHEKSGAHKHSVNKVVWTKSMLLSASDDKTIMGWIYN